MNEPLDEHAPLADPILEAARLAIVTGAPPLLIAVAAVAAMQVGSVGEVARELTERAEAIDRLSAAGAGGAGRRPAPLEPHLRFAPELGEARPEIADHAIRGRLIFRDMLVDKGFFQVVAWAIGGVDLSASDAELLDRSGVVTQLLDASIWPLALTRRIAAAGGGLGAALIGGAAALCTHRLAGLPVAGHMRFLDRVERDLTRGLSLDAVVEAVLRSGERVPGLGRPVLGPDERVPHQLALYARHGRARGASVRLSMELDRVFFARKHLRLNSAGLHGALMRDLGFSPAAAAALSTLYFLAPVLAHAVFAEERAARTEVALRSGGDHGDGDVGSAA
jgi:Citrate synthase, C-terminal domain